MRSANRWLRRALIAFKDTYVRSTVAPDFPKKPRGDPDIALAHIEGLLGVQADAWDSLDTKIAAIMGFSGSVLSIAVAVAVVRPDSFGDLAAILLVLQAVLFTLVTVCSLTAWHTRSFIVVGWQKVLSGLQRGEENDPFKWALYFGHVKAYERNRAPTELKALVVDLIAALFVVQVFVLAGFGIGAVT